MAVPGTSITGHVQSAVDGDIDDYRYMGPEILLLVELNCGNVDKILATKENDVYGMSMVVYEVGSHCPVFIRPEGRISR